MLLSLTDWEREEGQQATGICIFSCSFFFSRPFFPNSPSEVIAVLLAFSLQQFLKATVRDPGQESSWEEVKGRLTRPLGCYSKTHFSNTVFQGREGWERLWLLSLQIKPLKHTPSRTNKVPKQFIWDMCRFTHVLAASAIFNTDVYKD